MTQKSQLHDYRVSYDYSVVLLLTLQKFYLKIHRNIIIPIPQKEFQAFCTST